jgi:hypothetical protein
MLEPHGFCYKLYVKPVHSGICLASRGSGLHTEYYDPSSEVVAYKSLPWVFDLLCVALTFSFRVQFGDTRCNIGRGICGRDIVPSQNALSVK